jgi:TnpA family transposase
MRFVVPIRTVHAGPNSKYFGPLRGMTWYNWLSDQFTGLNTIPMPGTLCDSLVLLAVVPEQQTGLKPMQIMTDTGAYSDVVFGLFRLLGYRFCPLLADTGGKHFCRAGCRPPASCAPCRSVKTRLDWRRASSNSGASTKPCIRYASSTTKKCAGHASQLNRGEWSAQCCTRRFQRERGELRQRYREGQGDHLGALGLVVNMILLWNTIQLSTWRQYWSNSEGKATG